MSNQNQSTNKLLQDEEKKKDDGTPDMAAIMSKQMLIVIPAMILFTGLTFPSGLVLYWLTSTIFAIAQQWMIMHKDAE